MNQTCMPSYRLGLRPLALLLAGLFGAVGTAQAQSAACASNEATQTLNVTNNPWTAGSLSYSATIGSGASAITVNASVTNNNWVSGWPANTTLGNLASFGYRMNVANLTTTNTITFTFSKPVNRMRLIGTDIDYGGGNGNFWGDRLTVSGQSPTGATVLPSAITPASNAVVVSGNSAAASSTNLTSCATTAANCNANFDFNAPISSLTIIYGNQAPPAAGNPPEQVIGLAFGGFCVQNPDPAITKTAPASATVGSAFNFVLTAANPGSAAAPVGVQVNDTLNANLYTINAITPASGWSCTPNTGFPINTGIVSLVCTSTAPLAAGASGVAVATINVTPKAGALPGPIANTATIPAGSGGDINNSNNSSSTSTTLAAAVTDLQITKTDGTTQATQGGTTTYTIVVTNAGPTAASGAVITDPAATGLSCTTASCTAAGGASCPVQTGATLVSALQGAGAAIPVLPVNGSVTLTMTCTVN